MDLERILDLLQRYPPWVRYLTAAWLVGAALLIALLITLRGPKPAPVSPTPEPAPRAGEQAPRAGGASQADQAPSADLSFEQYARRLQGFGDRFLERQVFVESLAGRRLSWRGYVESVSSNRSGVVTIVLIAKPDLERPPLFVYGQGDAFRTKAFSLRRGDEVQVTGALELSSPTAPSIEAQELMVVKPVGQQG